MYHRKNVFKEMDSLRRTLDQMFSDFPFTASKPVSRFAFLPAHSARQYPLINMFDDEDNLYIECLAPGLDPNELQVMVENNTVTLKGTKNHSPKDVDRDAYHRSERAAGKFNRTIEVGREIDPDKVTATYKHGLLLITLGKTEKAKPRRIEIATEA